MKKIFLLLLIILSSNIFSQKSEYISYGLFNSVKVSTGENIDKFVPVSFAANPPSDIITKNEPSSDGPNAFSWQLLFTAPGKVFKDISFANTQVGYIVTELGSVYRSTNGGNNWVSVMSLGFPYYWYGVHALSVDTIVIAGFNNQDSIRHGAMRWSFDGGATWSTDIVLSRPTNGVGWLDRVHFFNQNTGIVFNGLSGACYYTTTGGKTTGAWTFVQIDPAAGWFAGNYTLLNSGLFYAAGITLSKSTDFGHTWLVGPCADNTFDGGVDFLASNTQFGWTGGGSISPTVSGWTHRTTDGGTSWSPRQNNFAFPIRVVKFFDQNTGLAIGGHVNIETGGIFSTSNGGTNWNQDVSTAAEMFSLDYNAVSPDSMDVWCVGSTGGGTGFTGKLYKARIQNLVGISQSGNELPKSFELFQNYPNPFNPKTVISYQLAVNSYVKIEVFDITGQLITALVSQKQNAGSYKMDFDGTNLSSGIYFYKLEVRHSGSSTGDFSSIKKMVLVK